MIAFDVTTRFEINVGPQPDATELVELGSFAAQNRCPAVVVPPEFVYTSLTVRSTHRHPYKVIAAIGFGRNDFALDKFKNLDQNVFHADGFDILLTSGRSEAETQNELRAFKEFVRDRINPTAEIRVVLNCFSRQPDQLAKFYKGLIHNAPSYIRTEESVVLAEGRCNPDLQVKSVDDIRGSGVSYPIKMSGNVSAATLLNLWNRVERYDVTVRQATEVVKMIKGSNIKLPTRSERVQSRSDVRFEVTYGDKTLSVPVALVEKYQNRGFSEDDALRMACEEILNQQ